MLRESVLLSGRSTNFLTIVSRAVSRTAAARWLPCWINSDLWRGLSVLLNMQPLAFVLSVHTILSLKLDHNRLCVVENENRYRLLPCQAAAVSVHKSFFTSLTLVAFSLRFPFESLLPYSALSARLNSSTSWPKWTEASSPGVGWLPDPFALRSEAVTQTTTCKCKQPLKVAAHLNFHYISEVNIIFVLTYIHLTTLNYY